MIALAKPRTFTVALVGNPNTGKSTLFGGLVGVHQHVGNYPGVTVEKRIGRTSFAGRRFELVDLPGLYSLAPRSRDEMVVVDLLVGRRRGAAEVDAVVCIVDACNLERNLYLVSQVLELGLPVVLALNMLDVAERRGIRIDLARLQRQLGLPVVPIQANRRIGLTRLMTVLADVAAEMTGAAGVIDAADLGPAAENLPSPFGRGAGGEGENLPSPFGGGAGGEGENLPSPFGRGAGGEGENLPSPFGRGAGGEGKDALPHPALTLPLAQRERGSCKRCHCCGPGVWSETCEADIACRGAMALNVVHAHFTPLPDEFEAEVSALEAELAAESHHPAGGPLPRCLVRRLLLDTNGYLQRSLLKDLDGRWAGRLAAARERLSAAGTPAPLVETSARFDWARRVLEGVVVDPGDGEPTTSDRIDRVLTHRIFGLLIFAAVMLIVFQSVFVWARPAMRGIESAFGTLGGWVEMHMAEGALRSLTVDGVIGGVGAVLTFLPQILILFAFLGLLEDCGYMARTAFLMDRLMSRVGLSGKSFIPLLSSFACAVPGIMATRVIEDERDRLTTILVAPLLTCSARLPIYAMLIAAFIPAQSYLGGLLSLQGLTLAGLYLLGILTAVVCALIFKRTILRGATPPFVMELPAYKWPSPRTVLMRMAERGWLFVRCAGTLILLVSILVWAALYFPHDPNVTHQEQQRLSYLGQAGQVIEPAVKPLGWDWRIGCSVIASLPARELVVATMGVMYHIDDEPEANDKRWTETLRTVTWDGTDRPVYTLPVALSIMVFFALCAECAATLAAIRRETNSWRWPAFTFGYMTTLAYTAALVTYQVGTWIAG